MTPQKQRPRTVTATARRDHPRGRAILSAGNPARVLPFRPRRSRCAGCGVAFVPVRPSHSWCRRCYAWLAVAAYTRRAAAALREARR